MSARQGRNVPFDLMVLLHNKEVLKTQIAVGFCAKKKKRVRSLLTVGEELALLALVQKAPAMCVF